MIGTLLAGTKTQTRRLAWRAPNPDPNTMVQAVMHPTTWQKARPGDRVWVKAP